MPLFAVTNEYADRQDELDAVRPEHRAFLGSLHGPVSVLSSGPLPAAEPYGAGALIIFHADDADAVRRALADDPFRRAGLIADQVVRRWTPVLGQWSDLA